MAMSDYTPSFYNTGSNRRDHERRGSWGGGGYGGPDAGYGGIGDYRAGAYVNTGSFDHGGYKSNPGAGGGLSVPYRGSNFSRPHANMMSTEREQLMRMQAQQLQVERQQQVEEKKRRDAEMKERERLEDQLLEESIRRQQEKMRLEYEEEINRKKKKEAEQKRRREAQLAHLEAMRIQAEEEKKSRLARSHRPAASDDRNLYSRGKSTKSPEPDDRRNRFLSARIENDRDARGGVSARRASVGGRTRRGREATDGRRPLRPDADFGLNLGRAAQSTRLSTTYPNRFFDRDNTETVATPPPPPAPPFEWKIKMDNISEEEKNKLEQVSEEEIRNFRDNNTDVMSQLNAMKRGLRTGAGRGDDRPPSTELKKDDSANGFAPTIPSGSGGPDVDRYKVPTAPPSPYTTRKMERANNRRRSQASSLDLDGTSGTVLRKYLEHTKTTMQS